MYIRFLLGVQEIYTYFISHACAFRYGSVSSGPLVLNCKGASASSAQADGSEEPTGSDEQEEEQEAISPFCLYKTQEDIKISIFIKVLRGRYQLPLTWLRG